MNITIKLEESTSLRFRPAGFSVFFFFGDLTQNENCYLHKPNSYGQLAACIYAGCAYYQSGPSKKKKKAPRLVAALHYGLLKVGAAGAGTGTSPSSTSAPPPSSSVWQRWVYEEVLALWFWGADTKTWHLTLMSSYFPLTCNERFKKKKYTTAELFTGRLHYWLALPVCNPFLRSYISEVNR